MKFDMYSKDIRIECLKNALTEAQERIEFLENINSYLKHEFLTSDSEVERLQNELIVATSMIELLMI